MKYIVMIKVLDCTLRDGGYINNWRFGYYEIKSIINEMEKTNIDILEIGFLKDEPYQADRTIFNSISQISRLISNRKNKMQYAAMIEAASPIPVNQIEPCSKETIDIIRVVIWKTKYDKYGNIVNNLMDSYEYCRHIVEKGYKLCIQPARIDQYTYEEFISMIKLFETLNPMAIYIVDSWGILNIEQILKYVKIADENMKQEIAIGYHGHNNMMQVFASAAEFICYSTNRDLIVDGSIYGIGRGAGNLNLEIFVKYLNNKGYKKYQMEPIYRIYEKYISRIYEKHKWGYNFYYLLTAIYHCNPNYAEYLGNKKNISVSEFENILRIMNEKERIIFSKEKADEYAKAIKEI